MKSKNTVNNNSREMPETSEQKLAVVPEVASKMPYILKKELEEKYYEIRKNVYAKALQSGFIYSWEDICHDVIERILEKGIPPTKWDDVIMSILDKWKKKRARSREVSLPNYLRKMIEP